MNNKITALSLALIIALSCLLCGCKNEEEPDYPEISSTKKENAVTQSSVTQTATTQKRITQTAASPYKYRGVSIMLPDGFTIKDMSGIPVAVPGEYPNKTDNISFSYDSNSISAYTEESLLATVRTLNSELEKLDEYVTTVIGGLACVYISYPIASQSGEIKQKMYVFEDSDETVIITFTIVSGDYNAEFESAIKTVTAA